MRAAEAVQNLRAVGRGHPDVEYYSHRVRETLPDATLLHRWWLRRHLALGDE
jgi:hypothetical protein